jgi:hypothetical protein
MGPTPLLGGGFGVPEPYKSALIAQGVVTASTRGVGPIGFTVEGINEFGHRLLACFEKLKVSQEITSGCRVDPTEW